MTDARTSREPSYRLMTTEVLEDRVHGAKGSLEHCTLCPRRCGVNRVAGEKGFCRTGARPFVSSYSPHFGEEAPLVGRHGSGTIFFGGCNLGCIFCQNYAISHLDEAAEISPRLLADSMLWLQEEGCHNINLVTPTHQVPMILESLLMARKGGLAVPLVYNCGGYECVETLRWLDGIVDIYMPDIKFSDDHVAKKYCKADGYWRAVTRAVLEMHRQVGDLVLDGTGVAQRGLLVRHLVMPNGLAGTGEVVRFLAEEISQNTYLNIMAQYHPCYKAHDHTELARRPTSEEYSEAILLADRAGLHRLDHREARARKRWL